VSNAAPRVRQNPAARLPLERRCRPHQISSGGQTYGLKNLTQVLRFIPFKTPSQSRGSTTCLPLFESSDSALAAALGAVSGEIHASSLQLAALDGEAVMDLVRDEIAARASAAEFAGEKATPATSSGTRFTPQLGSAACATRHVRRPFVDSRWRCRHPRLRAWSGLDDA
jgi:hypothetical protein